MESYFRYVSKGSKFECLDLVRGPDPRTHPEGIIHEGKAYQIACGTVFVFWSITDVSLLVEPREGSK